MMSSQLGRVINVYGFISSSITPITSKPGRIVEQYAPILPCGNDDVTKTRPRDECYGFMSTSASPITTSVGRMVEQHALILFCRNDDFITTRQCDLHLWLYLHFSVFYNNQTSQEGRPLCTDFI